ncbi:MAG: histidine kinase N-terminal 7TM domain-containing protein [Clostridiaceae bacterium]
MIFHWYPYHVLTILLMLISVVLLGYIFVHRHKTGAWYSLGILCLMLLWSVTQGLEFSVQDLRDKLIFANIQYIPITTIPVLYLYLSLCFSRKDYLLKKKYLPYLLVIMPVVLNILLWTDPYHGLIRQALHLNAEGIVPTIGKRFGVTMLPFAVYNFSLTAATLVILANTWMDKHFHYRDQAKYLFLGLLIPTCTNFLHFFGVDFYNIDMTPFSFAITGILLTYGIFRHGLFDLVPIALSHIVNEMKPGLIVYDKSLRLIDINPSAIYILGVGGQRIIGQPVSDAFAHVPELVQVIEQRRSCKNEISYCDDNSRSSFEVTVTHLENTKGTSLGWMAQIYDITERKTAEDKLKQDKENAMLLYKNAEQTSISNESAFLQAQIKPHFLYNALNVIAVLCRVDSEKARELILDLSNYMHHSFDFKNLEKYIAFEEELEFIQAYVRIEQARFKDRVNVIYEIDDTEGLRLSPLLLQPLVENAIRHGIRKNETGRTVVLRVKNLKEHYLIEIEDDGAGMTPEQLEAIQQGQGSGGVGLANIQKRLRMLYGTQLFIESRQGIGTKVTMTLPKRRDDEI